jgi:hypothetical protein
MAPTKKSSNNTAASKSKAKTVAPEKDDDVVVVETIKDEVSSDEASVAGRAKPAAKVPSGAKTPSANAPPNVTAAARSGTGSLKDDSAYDPEPVLPSVPRKVKTPPKTPPSSARKKLTKYTITKSNLNKGAGSFMDISLGTGTPGTPTSGSNPSAGSDFLESIGIKPTQLHIAKKIPALRGKLSDFDGKTPFVIKGYGVNVPARQGFATGVGFTVLHFHDEKKQSWPENRLSNALYRTSEHAFDAFNISRPARFCRNGELVVNQNGYAARIFYSLFHLVEDGNQPVFSRDRIIAYLRAVQHALQGLPDMDRSIILFEPERDLTLDHTWSDMMEEVYIRRIMRDLHGDLNEEFYDQNETAIRCFYRPGTMSLDLAQTIGAPVDEVRPEERDLAERHVEEMAALLEAEQGDEAEEDGTNSGN